MGRLSDACKACDLCKTANDQAPDTRIVVALSWPLLGASVTARTFPMLAYLTILTASIAGLAGGPPWVIAATAIMLSSLSYLRYGHLYERGRDAGLFSLVDETVVRSIFNAVVATGSAYGFGWLLRII